MRCNKLLKWLGTIHSIFFYQKKKQIVLKQEKLDEKKKQKSKAFKGVLTPKFHVPFLAFINYY